MNKNYVIKDAGGNILRHVNVPEEEIENQLDTGETYDDDVDSPVSPAASPIP